jgi:hypothetical protein
MKAEKKSLPVKKSVKSFGGSEKSRTFASAFALKAARRQRRSSLKDLHRQK